MKHIAIAGLGVVGGGVAEILLKNAALLEKNAGEKIVLKAIYTRTPKKDGPFAPYFVSDFSAIEQDPEIDLVVETIGGSTVALDFVSRALKAGKHVVTANKQLIAEHGLELFALAKANGVNILFEASVAGGIPVLNPLTRCLGANEITEVSGILNGTTNYILTQMLENGQSYVYIEGKNKKLKKQYVRTGQTLYSTYIEVKEGVSETDWIAFPYGKAVKEGAPVKELEGSGFADQLY